MYKTGIFTISKKGKNNVYTLFDQDGNKLATRTSHRPYVAAIFVEFTTELTEDGGGAGAAAAPNFPKGKVITSVPEINYFGRIDLIKDRCNNSYYNDIAQGKTPEMKGRKLISCRAYICKPIPHHADIDPRYVELTAGLILKLAEAKIKALSLDEIERAFQEVSSPEYCYNAAIKLLDAGIITLDKVRRKEYSIALEAIPEAPGVETVNINGYQIQWNPLFNQYISSHPEIGAGLGAYNRDQINNIINDCLNG